MALRIRVAGYMGDIQEYGIEAPQIEFPCYFLEIPSSFTKIQEWLKTRAYPIYYSSNQSQWMELSEANKKNLIKDISETFPEVKIPQLESDCYLKFRKMEFNLKENPLLMGILNVTPDSFSDGGLYAEESSAIKQAELIEKSGARIIDIGGESTRPGAEEVSFRDEWNRLEPVLKYLCQKPKRDMLVSVDTYKAQTANKALKLGADIINDISGLTFDPQMAEVIAEHDAAVIIMHIQGTPRHMQKNPFYNHLMDELLDFFERQISFAEKKGIKQIIIDPGIGFGKRPEDNFEIIRRLKELKQFNCPVLLGLSRKSMIWRTLNINPGEADPHSAFLNFMGIINGADIIRVHDVGLHSQMISLLKLYHCGKAQ